MGMESLAQKGSYNETESQAGTKTDSKSPSTAPIVLPENTPTLEHILRDQIILITGAAGFVGTALIHRLIDPSLGIRRVFTLIRDDDNASRLPNDLYPYIAKVDDSGDLDDHGLLVMLKGDCSIPGFGLSQKENKWLEQVTIVVHSASHIKFGLPFPKAMKAITDLAYNMCHFTLNSPNVRTHIHLSTCFTGWFLPPGSAVREELIPTLIPGVDYEEHANSYFHSKAIAEGVVNAIGRSPQNKVAWRILRLSTLGPALLFPTPGWGAGHPSSPICTGIAAPVIDPALWLPEAELDALPIDIAINQLLGLTAAAHHTGANNASYPLPHGSNVPIYHIAAGRGSPSIFLMTTFNTPEFKLKRPHVSPRNFLAAYRPMATKVVRFDTSRTRRALGLSPYELETTACSSVTCNESGETVRVTDAPINTGSLVVDLDSELEKNGGWVEYMRLVKDKMVELLEPESKVE